MHPRFQKFLLVHYAESLASAVVYVGHYSVLVVIGNLSQGCVEHCSEAEQVVAGVYEFVALFRLVCLYTEQKCGFPVFLVQYRDVEFEIVDNVIDSRREAFNGKRVACCFLVDNLVYHFHYAVEVVFVVINRESRWGVFVSALAVYGYSVELTLLHVESPDAVVSRLEQQLQLSHLPFALL